jgi:hypothetical protein
MAEKLDPSDSTKIALPDLTAENWTKHKKMLTFHFRRMGLSITLDVTKTNHWLDERAHLMNKLENAASEIQMRAEKDYFEAFVLFNKLVRYFRADSFRYKLKTLKLFLSLFAPLKVLKLSKKRTCYST